MVGGWEAGRQGVDQRPWPGPPAGKHTPPDACCRCGVFVSAEPRAAGGDQSAHQETRPRPRPRHDAQAADGGRMARIGSGPDVTSRSEFQRYSSLRRH